MTKGVVIENILLAINGGTLNDESSVRRRDIAAYLPAAVNYAMSKSYNIDLEVEGSRDLSSLFFGTFYDLPVIREANRKPRIDMPKATVAMPRNQGIRIVRTPCGNTFAPLMEADLHTIDYYVNIFPGETFFRLKAPKSLEFYGLNPLVNSIGEVQIVTRLEDLDDTDELPVQMGLEQDVISISLDHFVPQRRTQSDKIIDSVDINAQQ